MKYDYICPHGHKVTIEHPMGEVKPRFCREPVEEEAGKYTIKDRCKEPLSRYFGDQATPSVWRTSKPTD